MFPNFNIWQLTTQKAPDQQHLPSLLHTLLTIHYLLWHRVTTTFHCYSSKNFNSCHKISPQTLYHRLLVFSCKIHKRSSHVLVSHCIINTQRKWKLSISTERHMQFISPTFNTFGANLNCLYFSNFIIHRDRENQK